MAQCLAFSFSAFGDAHVAASAPFDLNVDHELNAVQANFKGVSHPINGGSEDTADNGVHAGSATAGQAAVAQGVTGEETDGTQVDWRVSVRPVASGRGMPES
jgi:hypothetical protein